MTTMVSRAGPAVAVTHWYPAGLDLLVWSLHSLDVYMTCVFTCFRLW